MRQTQADNHNVLYMLDALMNYGAAMQIYNNYNVDNLANASNLYVFSPAAINIGDSYNKVISGAATGITKANPSIVIGSKVSLVYNFTISGKISDYSFKIVDSETGIERDVTAKGSSKKYSVRVDNLSPTNFDKMITVVAKRKTEVRLQ